MTDEIEYKYVKGKGWVAGYKSRLLENVTITIDTSNWRIQPVELAGADGRVWRFIR